MDRKIGEQAVATLLRRAEASQTPGR